MDAEPKKYKWFLKWSGRGYDHTRLKACLAYLKSDMRLARDSDAQLITGEEYTKMVAEELIAPPLKTSWGSAFWCIKPGQLGMIALSDYERYVTDWQRVDIAKTDFEEGWNAHEKYLQMLSDWDEAIGEGYWRAKGEKECLKRMKKGDTPETEPEPKEYIWEAIDRIRQALEEE